MRVINIIIMIIKFCIYSYLQPRGRFLYGKIIQSIFLKLRHPVFVCLFTRRGKKGKGQLYITLSQTEVT